MIGFILCLCPETTGQTVADHRLRCDTEVKLIMHDSPAWLEQHLKRKPTPDACPPEQRFMSESHIAANKIYKLLNNTLSWTPSGPQYEYGWI